MTDLTSGVAGIFGQLSNGVQSLQTQLQNVIGNPTPPNSAPPPSIGTAGAGNTAASGNVPPENNTMLYVVIGVIAVVAVVLIVKS